MDTTCGEVRGVLELVLRASASGARAGGTRAGGTGTRACGSTGHILSMFL